MWIYVKDLVPAVSDSLSSVVFCAVSSVGYTIYSCSVLRCVAPFVTKWKNVYVILIPNILTQKVYAEHLFTGKGNEKREGDLLEY
jgi:hypothetical protein